MVRSFALYGGQFLLPLFLVRVQGYTENQIGLMILPGAVFIGLLFPFSGRFSDRYGAKPFIVVGLGIIIFFFLSLANVSSDTGFWGIQLPILIRGLGLGLMVTPLTSLALNSIPHSRSANGSVLLNLFQQLGGSLGIATLGSILELESHIYRSRGISERAATILSFQDAFKFGVLICVLAWLLTFALPKRFEGNTHGTA